MATRPLPEAADSRFAPYIAELHEFFATSGVPFGSPDDVFGFAERLREHGPFTDDLNSQLRSIILREGGAMPHAQLLEILSISVAGPEMVRDPQKYHDPLRQMLAFVAGVMRRPWNVPPGSPAEIVPFPTEAPRPAEPAAIPAEPAPEAATAATEAVSELIPPPETVPEAFAEEQAPPPVFPPLQPIAEPSRPFSAIAAALVEAKWEPPPPTHPWFETPPEPTLLLRTDDAAQPGPVFHMEEPAQPSVRNLLIATAVAIPLGAILALVVISREPNKTHGINQVPPHAATTQTSPAPALRAVSTPAGSTQLAPSPAAPTPAAPPTVASSRAPSTPTLPATTFYTGTSHPPKPSAYGEPLGSRRHPVWVYPPDSPTPAPAASPPQPEPAAASHPAPAPQQPQTEASPYYAPYNPASDIHPPQQPASQTAAPIVREPAHEPAGRNGSDASDQPADSRPQPQAAAGTRPFAVSPALMAANLISAPAPDYPLLARIAHAHGPVVVEAVIFRNGTVYPTHVLSGNHLLRGAAEEAVRRSRYRPYRVAGHAVDVATTVTIDFRIPTPPEDTQVNANN